MEQLGSYWTDFNEIRHLKNFHKNVEKIQVSDFDKKKYRFQRIRGTVRKHLKKPYRNTNEIL